MRDALKVIERAEDGQRVAPPDESAFSPWIDLGKFREDLRVVTRTRRSTMIPTLDRATEGGISGDTVVLAVGPPGSAKTALAVQLGLDRARKVGGRLYGYSPDQGGAQPLKRIASTFGNIAEDDDAFARFRAEVEPVLRVVDERRGGVTIESFRDLVLAAGDVAAVVIDTPQTVATEENEEERQRIEKTMGVAREIAERLLVPVFVCSHANRAATASRAKENRTLERSAGLGSASIEHRAQVVLFLERRDGSVDTEIDVLVVKASIAYLRFRLLLDTSTWMLREIDMAVAEAEREEKAARAQREKDQSKRFGRRAQVKAIILSKRVRPVSLVALRDAWKGTAGDLPRTLAVMVEDGALVETRGEVPKGGGHRPKFYDLADPNDRSARTDDSERSFVRPPTGGRPERSFDVDRSQSFGNDHSEPNDRSNDRSDDTLPAASGDDSSPRSEGGA